MHWFRHSQKDSVGGLIVLLVFGLFAVQLGFGGVVIALSGKDAGSSPGVMVVLFGLLAVAACYALVYSVTGLTRLFASRRRKRDRDGGIR